MILQYGAFFPTRDMPADRIAIRDWVQAAEAGQPPLSGPVAMLVDIRSLL